MGEYQQVTWEELKKHEKQQVPLCMFHADAASAVVLTSEALSYKPLHSVGAAAWSSCQVFDAREQVDAVRESHFSACFDGGQSARQAGGMLDQIS